MTLPLRTGVLPYANVAPLFGALVSNGSVDFVRGVPTQLNQWLLTGEIDVALVSTIHWARHRGMVARHFPVGLVSEGPVLSVLLASKVPFEPAGDPIKTYLTSESATSISLLEILAKDSWPWGHRLRFGVERADADAFLFIGDEALCEFYYHRLPHRLDLGGAWYQLTGLPMVWAVLCARKEFLERATGEFQTLWLRLEEASRSPERTQAAERTATRLGLPVDFIKTYFDGLSYVIGGRQEDGLQKFLELARRGEFVSREGNVQGQGL